MVPDSHLIYQKFMYNHKTQVLVAKSLLLQTNLFTVTEGTVHTIAV